MQNKQIIHFDTIYAQSKKDNNPFQSKFILRETLKSVSRIYLKSCEIAIGVFNIRAPYSFIRMLISVNGITSNLTLTLPNKSYSDISLFLIDLNLLLLNNITLNIGEITPQFSLSLTEVNKLVLKTTLNNSTIFFYNEGLILYHLGNLNSLIVSKTLISGSTYLNTYNLLYNYNLCFDNYYCMCIDNILMQTRNNHNTPCTFKINILSTSNSINYNSENSNFVQDIILPKNTNLNELSICFFDRYNNVLHNNNNEISFTLGFEF